MGESEKPHGVGFGLDQVTWQKFEQIQWRSYSNSPCILFVT